MTTDNNGLAKLIAADYVDFLLGGSARETLRGRMGGKELPSEPDVRSAIKEITSDLYAAERAEGKIPSDLPLIYFATRLFEGFSDAFGVELTKADQLRIGRSKLTYAEFFVEPALAMGVIHNYSSEREDAGVNWLSLRMKANNTPTYKICSNGVAVRHCMGEYSVLPMNDLQGAKLAVLTHPSFSDIKSQEVLHAASKILELPISVGQTVSVFGNDRVVRERDVSKGLIYKISRRAKGAKFSDVETSSDSDIEWRCLAAVSNVTPRIVADNLDNAHYAVKPAKLAFADCDTLILGAMPLFVKEGQYIVFTQADTPTILHEKCAIFIRQNENYVPVEVVELKVQMATTSKMNEHIPRTERATVSREETTPFPGSEKRLGGPSL